MPRVYFLPQWSAPADEALEDALCDSQALQRFAGIELDAEGVPDATTLLKFRRLLETRDLCKALFTAINSDLAARGLLLREGTLVDATPIAAPSSTKSEQRARDPAMHQAKKGNQWYFGPKAHLGTDRDGKLVHTVAVTAANVADIAKTAELLHGEERPVHADAGCTGVEKRPEIVALARPIDWRITGKRGLVKALAEGAHKEAIKAVEHAKAAVARGRRASLSPREESVRAPEDAVSRAGEKHAPTPRALRFGQRGDRRTPGCGVGPQANARPPGGETAAAALSARRTAPRHFTSCFPPPTRRAPSRSVAYSGCRKTILLCKAPRKTASCRAGCPTSSSCRR